MSLPVDYLEILERLGVAFVAYEGATSARAVLVGGAATAISTAGQFMSADFDVVAADDASFERAMIGAGFECEGGVGHLAGGFFHPSFPGYVVEQVSKPLFDGRSELGRLIRLKVSDESAIVLPPAEDLIADRLAQHAIASKTDDSRLLQAIALFKMASNLGRIDIHASQTA
ncbi:hypothetical protein [Sphingomonas parapaucimobilis]|uniref:hypothetical protein n=1 Tax=Sphingomonas parapaucimobilis TaxID=28213 RepID=UPI0035C82914